MNADALGQFLMIVFVPFVPVLAGAVVALIGSLLVVIIFRDFLPSDSE
jgi:hypothetical protein